MGDGRRGAKVTADGGEQAPSACNSPGEELSSKRMDSKIDMMHEFQMDRRLAVCSSNEKGCKQ
jgi:hypothetical protein